MRKHLFLYALLISPGLLAQPSDEEIQKNRVRKLLIRTIDKAGISEEKRWFDSLGYDSIYDFNGSIIETRNLFRDKRLEQQSIINSNGDTTEVIQYLYLLDGSIRKTYIDSSGKIILNKLYNNHGQLVRSESGQGFITLYKYNRAGKLATVSTQRKVTNSKDKKNNDPITIEKYAYDRNGNLIKKEKGGGTTTCIYEKGVLVSEQVSSDWEGYSFFAIYEHRYNEKGLIAKTVMKRPSGKKLSETHPETIIEYEYEYY